MNIDRCLIFLVTSVLYDQPNTPKLPAIAAMPTGGGDDDDEEDDDDDDDDEEDDDEEGDDH